MEKGVKCFHYKLICQRILSVCLLYHKHQIIYKNAEIKFQKLPKKKLHEEEKFKAAKTNNFLTNNFFLPSQSTAKKKFFMSNFSKYTLTIFLICLLLCRKWKFIFDTTETANNLFFPSLFQSRQKDVENFWCLYHHLCWKEREINEDFVCVNRHYTYTPSTQSTEFCVNYELNP